MKNVAVGTRRPRTCGAAIRCSTTELCQRVRKKLVTNTNDSSSKFINFNSHDGCFYSVSLNES